jgi:hypothetical protein
VPVIAPAVLLSTGGAAGEAGVGVVAAVSPPDFSDLPQPTQKRMHKKTDK